MKINHRIRGVILIFLAIALFLGAWVVTNYIQAEKLYPRPDDDFDFHIFQRYESECFKIYDVDLLFSKDSKNLLVTTAFEKKMQFYLFHSVDQSKWKGCWF